MEERIYCEGGCHCGAVRYRIALPLKLELIRCNCSICAMTGYLHLHVLHQDLELIQGEDALREYRFNTGQARHMFCRHCGVKSFYQPRSHPQAWSVNANCVGLPNTIVTSIHDFNGESWEHHVDEIEQTIN